MRSESAITLRRVVYNKCCKGGKVYITPFKKPPLFLSELLRYNGPSRSREFIKKIVSTTASLHLLPWELLLTVL